MSFVTTTPINDAIEPSIGNGDFWPEVDPAQIREAQRIDSTITVERLRSALIEAMATVNGELEAWRLLQIAAGHATLIAVPAAEIDDESIHLHRYRRAVGCLAKAGLIERYRDYDTTARGDRKADVLENPIDDLRRDARWAISDIQGVGRTTVELI